MFLEVSYTEWVGYLASLVLIISFMMNNVNKLRIINSVGTFVFVIYGVLLGPAWPIIITNAFILGLNLYHLLIKKD
ncbi:MAG: uroporphyrinogen decarboxylase [Flavobacteriaceae bacterium]|nr:uroporphyrinogen decarboxylase [Flavobacteriaceae bacterium]